MSVGAFILMLCPTEQSLLLGLRSNETKWSPNTWCPFGGTLEPSEYPIDTAIREYAEETTILPNSYIVYDEPICKLVSKSCDGDVGNMLLYIGLIPTQTIPTINNETQKFGWFSLDELTQINMHPILKKLFSDSSSIELIKSLLISGGVYV